MYFIHRQIFHIHLCLQKAFINRSLAYGLSKIKKTFLEFEETFE